MHSVFLQPCTWVCRELYGTTWRNTAEFGDIDEWFGGCCAWCMKYKRRHLASTYFRQRALKNKELTLMYLVTSHWESLPLHSWCSTFLIGSRSWRTDSVVQQHPVASNWTLKCLLFPFLSSLLQITCMWMQVTRNLDVKNVHNYNVTWK